jgi:hypothetical protein
MKLTLVFRIFGGLNMLTGAGALFFMQSGNSNSGK